MSAWLMRPEKVPRHFNVGLEIDEPETTTGSRRSKPRPDAMRATHASRETRGLTRWLAGGRNTSVAAW